MGFYDPWILLPRWERFNLKTKLKRRLQRNCIGNLIFRVLWATILQCGSREIDLDSQSWVGGLIFFILIRVHSTNFCLPYSPCIRWYYTWINIMCIFHHFLNSKWQFHINVKYLHEGWIDVFIIRFTLISFYFSTYILIKSFM
jgi:hypothetical protein